MFKNSTSHLISTLRSELKNISSDDKHKSFVIQKINVISIRMSGDRATKTLEDSCVLFRRDWKYILFSHIELFLIVQITMKLQYDHVQLT